MLHHWVNWVSSSPIDCDDWKFKYPSVYWTSPKQLNSRHFSALDNVDEVVVCALNTLILFLWFGGRHFTSFLRPLDGSVRQSYAVPSSNRRHNLQARGSSEMQQRLDNIKWTRLTVRQQHLNSQSSPTFILIIFPVGTGHLLPLDHDSRTDKSDVYVFDIVVVKNLMSHSRAYNCI